jgi:hypothetical protein
MKELIQLFTQIALLRRGPQDVPASILLLVLTVLGYFGVSFLVSSLLPPTPDWLAHLLLDVPFTLVWYVLLLKVVGRPERILQTTTAVFGFQTVLSPLAVLSEWLTLRFAQDSTWDLPVKLMGIVLVVWVIAANSHIVKAALEWSSAASVALVILQIVAGQALVLALFPVSAS